MGNSSSPGTASVGITGDGELTVSNATSEPPTTTLEHHSNLEHNLGSKSSLELPLDTTSQPKNSWASPSPVPDADSSDICVSTLPTTEPLLPLGPHVDADNLTLPTDDPFPILDADLPTCFDMPELPDSVVSEHLSDGTSAPRDASSEQYISTIHSSPNRHADPHVFNELLYSTTLPPKASPNDLDKTAKHTTAFITSNEGPLTDFRNTMSNSILSTSSSLESHSSNVLSITTKEPAPIVCRAVPLATTYADATNLASRFPDLASEILHNPISGTSGPSSQQEVLANASLPVSSDKLPPSIPTVQLPQSTLSCGPIHTATQPNWALAPPDVKYDSASLLVGPWNKRERKESQEQHVKRSRGSDSKHNEDHNSKEVSGRRRNKNRAQQQESYCTQGLSRPVRVNRGTLQYSSSTFHGSTQRKETSAIELGELFHKAMKMQQQQQVDDLVDDVKRGVAAGSETEAAKLALQDRCKLAQSVVVNADATTKPTRLMTTSKSIWPRETPSSIPNPSLPELAVFSLPRPAPFQDTTSSEEVNNGKQVDPEWRRASEYVQGRDSQYVPRHVPPDMRGVRHCQTSPFGSDANAVGFGHFVTSRNDIIPAQDTASFNADRPSLSTTQCFDALRLEPGINTRLSFQKNPAGVVFNRLEASETGIIAAREEYALCSGARKDPNIAFSEGCLSVGTTTPFDIPRLAMALPHIQVNQAPLQRKGGFDGTTTRRPYSPNDSTHPFPHGLSQSHTGSKSFLVESPESRARFVSVRTGTSDLPRTCAPWPHSVAETSQGYHAQAILDTLNVSDGNATKGHDKNHISEFLPVGSKRPAQDQNCEGGFDTFPGIIGQEKSNITSSSSQSGVQLQSTLGDESEFIINNIKTIEKTKTSATLGPLARDKFDFPPAGMGSNEQVKISFPGPVGSRRPCRGGGFDVTAGDRGS